jgi:hypothetical protein
VGIVLRWDASWSESFTMILNGALGACVALFAICAGLQKAHILFERIAKEEVQRAMFPTERELALVTAGQLKSGKLHQPLACLHIPF